MRKTFLFLVPQQCSLYLLFTYQVKSAIDDKWHLRKRENKLICIVAHWKYWEA